MASPHGWSSLPTNLVNRVADCLLATNDLDCYTDMRAVCHYWRSVTADPSSKHDPRFHPSRWVMLGEIDYYTRRYNDPLLFVNTTTGRFLRRSLPLLRGYHLFTTSTGGFLVVEDAGPPYATRLLNPFTGSTIRFKARMPPEDSMTAHVVFVGDRPTLVVAGRTSSENLRFYHADTESKDFSRVHGHGGSFDSIRSPLLLLPLHCAEVEPGHFLVVNDRQRHLGIRVFRIRTNYPTGPASERVRSIGDYALFVGTGRCIGVRAHCFPSIRANCIYYKETEGARSGTYWLYDLAHGREERIAPSAILPATVAQLFADYTVCSSQYGHLQMQREWKSNRFIVALRRLGRRSKRL